MLLCPNCGSEFDTKSQICPYCAHASDNMESDIPKIAYAIDILNDIKNAKPVNYDGYIILGNSLDLPVDNDGKKIINSQISIKNSVVKCAINFQYAVFKNTVDFGSTIFNKKVFFFQSEFKTSANFYNAEFKDVASFQRTTFCSEANFGRAKFFAPALFDGDAGFETSFRGTASFSDVHFFEETYFNNAIFERQAAFIKTRFDRNVSFNMAKFNNELNLQFSSINYMYMDAAFGPDFQLKLCRSNFARLDVPWNTIKGRLYYNDSAYLALTKNYNNLGWFKDADDCYYEYRTLRRREHLIRWDYFFDLIAWIPYGYGIRYYYPLILMIGLFFAFAFVFLLGKQAHSVIEALDYSSVILTTTTQVDHLTGTCRFWSIIERITGWLLMASFLVVLAKKTIR